MNASDSNLTFHQIEHELAEAMDQWTEACEKLLESQELDPAHEIENKGQDYTLAEDALQEIVALYLQEARSKRDKLARYRIHLKEQEESAKAQVKRAQARQKRFERQREQLDSYILSVMRGLKDNKGQPVKKLEGDEFTIRSWASPDKVEILDEDQIPRNRTYGSWRFVPSLSKIKEHMKKVWYPPTTEAGAVKVGRRGMCPGTRLLTDRKHVRIT